MTLRFGLLGDGISNSRQPRLMCHLAQLTDVDLSYELIDRADSAAFNPVEQVLKLQRDGFAGINVTHPYKQRIASLVTRDATDAEQRIGTYNTLRFTDSGILGANTDYSGFKQGYRFQRGDSSPGTVLLCGAGGVGRAIAIALGELGAAEILVSDLVQEQAKSLVIDLSELGFEASFVDVDNIPEAMAMATGLVNCTALGMLKNPGCAFPVAQIKAQSWAFDAVYTPLETTFLAACRREELEIVSGFNLWVFQGLDSFRILTGIEIIPDQSIIDTTFEWLE